MLRWHPLEDRRGTKKSLELIGGAFRWLVLVNHNLKFKGWVHYNNSDYLRITKICGTISGKYRIARQHFLLAAQRQGQLVYKNIYVPLTQTTPTTQNNQDPGTKPRVAGKTWEQRDQT